MKEYMDEYFDSYHILLEKNYKTWDPHLCHWNIFDWSLEACMHLANGGLLSWRYKHFNDFLMRHLLDVHFYYVVMHFDDIYYVIMMFEECIQENAIPEFSFLMVWVGENS